VSMFSLSLVRKRPLCVAPFLSPPPFQRMRNRRCKGGGERKEGFFFLSFFFFCPCGWAAFFPIPPFPLSFFDFAMNSREIELLAIRNFPPFFPPFSRPIASLSGPSSSPEYRIYIIGTVIKGQNSTRYFSSPFPLTSGLSLKFPPPLIPDLGDKSGKICRWCRSSFLRFIPRP